MKTSSLALVAALFLASPPAVAEIMVVGIDSKFAFDDAGGRVFKPDTGDKVEFFDLADHAHPRSIGALALTNSVVGPPTNLAITPDQRLALIANSLTTVRVADGTWKPAPDDRVFVVDLSVRPPKLITTLKVGLQPSGLAISADGKLAIIANRVGKSLSVLSIEERSVTVVDTVPMDDVVTSVAITPDGKRALVSKFAAHRVALMSIQGTTVRPIGKDMPVGQWPYTVAVTPDGKLGLAGATGDQATSDGNLDPVAVIEMGLDPPRVIDFVTAGDSIEGLVVSPTGEFAVASILQGSMDGPKGAWFKHPVGSVALLRVEKGKVTLAGNTDVGAFPEGVAFSDDGRWVYAGNFASNSISVLRLEGGRLIDTHGDVALSGPPAALRVGSQ